MKVSEINLWHHADLQVKCLTYMAVANNYGESNGRPRPPDTPYEPSVEATATQAASAAVPVAKTMDDYIKQVRQEYVETGVKPGVVADVNLANAVYDVKKETAQTTPVFDADEEEAAKSGGDSDVSIEGVPITTAEVVQGGDVESSPMVYS